MFSSFRHNASDGLLILSVLVVASCGLAYELIAGALASYVLGDSVLQFSTVIGTYLFAMGVGSHVFKYVPEERLIQRFIEIETLVGLIGGLSAIGLFLAFAWLPEFRALLYVVIFCIGVLVGMEIPLVMRILHVREQAFSELVSRVLTFDYLGALIVSLLFPMVLAPALGLARSAVLFGLANVMVAGWTAWHFFPPPRRGRFAKTDHSIRITLLRRIAIVLVILILAMIYADKLLLASEQERFDAPIIYATSSPYQRLVVTQRHGHMQLFLNGNLQFSSRDEHRYHEALVHPAMQYLHNQRNAMHPDINVLILGGGDGMAAREILKYSDVNRITLVDLDEKMTDVFTRQPRFKALNNGSLSDEKVHVINQDAYQWLESHAPQRLYDLVIIDLPDPSQYSLAKLYSVSMYRLIRPVLSHNGLLVVQATSPYYAPRSFWSINATLATAGFVTTPYHAYVPSFGEWGFIVAGKNKPHFTPPDHYDVAMKFLSAETTQAMFSFPVDMQPVDVLPNTLDKQPLVRYYQRDWADE
ncbi:MAG: spermidine synthase [Gammaproteobacteria bacterium]|nr:MAG: spermidine synthase [Gammaproteobacteria bacterium]